MDLPLTFFVVARSWAIHSIDKKDINVLLHLDTPNKELTHTLSEIPYFCPNKIHALSPFWNSRNIHMSTQNSKMNYKKDNYKIEFECLKDKNKPFVNLFLHLFHCDQQAYCVLFDDKDNLWDDKLCLQWKDKSDPDSLWSVCFASNIPPNAKKINFHQDLQL